MRIPITLSTPPIEQLGKWNHSKSDWLILMACQPILGYLIATGLEIAFIFTIFVWLFPESYFCTQSFRVRIIFKQIYLTHRYDPNSYYHSGPSKPGSNCNKEVPQSQDLQNWSLTIRRSLVSCPGHPLFWGIQSAYSRLRRLGYSTSMVSDGERVGR